MLSVRRVLAYLGVGFVIIVLGAAITDRMGDGTNDSWGVAQSMVWLVAGLLWLGAAWWLFFPRKRR